MPQKIPTRAPTELLELDDMTQPTETEQLIDALIGHWCSWDEHEEFYLTNLAPGLVSDISKGDNVEQDILGKLRRLLNQDEWNVFPKLIAERRVEIHREIESERGRRDAEERERKEVARIAVLKRQEAARIAALRHREVARVAAQKREEGARERLRQEQLRKQAQAHRDSLLRALLGTAFLDDQQCEPITGQGRQRASRYELWCR